MQTLEAFSGTFDHPDDDNAARERALARLARLVQLHQEQARVRAGDRPVPLPMLRRAVFAAYLEAVAAGAAAEASRLLQQASADGV